MKEEQRIHLDYINELLSQIDLTIDDLPDPQFTAAKVMRLIELYEQIKKSNAETIETLTKVERERMYWKSQAEKYQEQINNARNVLNKK